MPRADNCRDGKGVGTMPKEKNINEDEITSEELQAPETHEKKNNKRGKLSVKQKVAIIVLLALYVLVLAAVSVFVFYRPKVDTTSKIVIETYIDSNGQVVEKEVVHERQEGTYNILLLGHDRAAMLTDVFMLVNIDNRSNSITVMQIPRDTWIDNTDEVYILTNKINATFSSYYYQFLNMGTESEEAYDKALYAVADLLEESLGIRIDYSAIMDLDGFINIVDLLGGVEMDIPINMYYDDPEQNLYIAIPAGHQVLNGAQAEGLVRYRKGYATADLGRQNTQKQFMTALFAKAKSSISLSNVDILDDLCEEIIKNIDTDMSTAEVLFFAKSVLQCDLSTINMMTMPGNLAGGYFVMNRAAVRDVVNTCYNVFDKEITDGMFDPRKQFSCSYDGGIDYTYYLPADQVWDNNVYNGEDISTNDIIPRG